MKYPCFGREVRALVLNGRRECATLTTGVAVAES